LLSNAIKYSPAETEVVVFQEQLPHGRKLAVSDQGPGIETKDQGRLFKDFSKLGHKPTAGESSTGLGLAISRRIIEAHKGIIGVDSCPGKGSTFWFVLPD
jgi:signal transduction histidine kinase